MFVIETKLATHNGFTIKTEALMLYVHGCRFCLAINEYIIVEAQS